MGDFGLVGCFGECGWRENMYRGRMGFKAEYRVGTCLLNGCYPALLFLLWVLFCFEFLYFIFYQVVMGFYGAFGLEKEKNE